MGCSVSKQNRYDCCDLLADQCQFLEDDEDGFTPRQKRDLLKRGFLKPGKHSSAEQHVPALDFEIVGRNGPGKSEPNMMSVKAFSHVGAPVRAPLVVRSPEAESRRNFIDTTLHMAAHEGNCDQIRDLVLRQHYPIDAIDPHGQTPLIIACKCRQFHAAKLLVVLGSNIATLDDSLRSALDHTIDEPFRKWLTEYQKSLTSPQEGAALRHQHVSLPPSPPAPLPHISPRPIPVPPQPSKHHAPRLTSDASVARAPERSMAIHNMQASKLPRPETPASSPVRVQAESGSSASQKTVDPQAAVACGGAHAGHGSVRDIGFERPRAAHAEGGLTGPSEKAEGGETGHGVVKGVLRVEQATGHGSVRANGFELHESIDEEAESQFWQAHRPQTPEEGVEAGPEALKAEVEAAVRMLLSSRQLEFQGGKAELTQTGRTTLNEVRYELDVLPIGAIVEVHSHTNCQTAPGEHVTYDDCERENPKGHLCRARCDTVIKALASGGLAEKAQFVARPWGCTEPTVGPRRLVRIFIK